MFKSRMATFEEFQSALESSSKVFSRPALAEVYDFFTKGNDAEPSVVFVQPISSGDRAHVWRTIHMGVTATIRAIRDEFGATPNSSSVDEYIEELQLGKNNTHLLLSVKGTHHPLVTSTKLGKGSSLIEMLGLYTHNLQGDSSLTGGLPMTGMRIQRSSKLLLGR
jgi:hypothetical protein